MEGEGGLHWNNNKSVPLNSVDNSRALAFTELQRQALSVLRALYFLIGPEHAIVAAKEIERGRRGEEKRGEAEKTPSCIASTLAQH